MDGVKPLTDWAAELRAFRHRNALKQEAAASLLGVSQAYISRVESGDPPLAGPVLPLPPRGGGGVH